jgi:hypothetical protein
LYSELLHTSATVAATLAGFIGVVFVLGRRSEGDLSIHERSAVFHLLYTALGVLFFSLVMSVFLASTVEQGLVWQVGNGAFGLYHLLGAGRATAEALRGEFGVRKVIAWPLFIGSYPIIGANFAAAAGYFPEAAPLVFMIGIVWLLLVTAATFVSLLSTGGRVA